MLLLRHLALPLSLSLACALGAEDRTARIALGLTGQFLPGELTVLDIDVYDAAALRCVEGRQVEGDQGALVASETGVALPSDPVSFTLDAGTYVVRARAGAPADLAPGGEPLAEGCATVTIARGNETEASVPLHRRDRCGDGTLDLAEQCDDGNRAVGDGCDGSCRTEPAWLNQDVAGNQSLPRAAGEGNLVATCWRSDLRSNDEAPMRWLDRTGAPRGDELFQSESTRQDCTSLDILGGAALMTSMMGDADSRWPVIAMWDSSLAALPGLQTGAAGALDTVATFVGLGRAVVATVRPGAAAGERQVLAAYFRMEGGAVVADGSPFAVDDSGAAEDQDAPALAGSADGGFVVAFRGGLGRIWARVFDGPSSPGALLGLYDGPGVCGPPAVARLGGPGEARYVVVFSDGEFGRIVARVVTATGALSGSVRVNEVDRSGDPTVAALEEGALIAWAEPGPDGSEVYARVLVSVDATGEPVYGHLAEGRAVTSAPLLVNPGTAGGQDQPAVGATTADGETTAVVLWREVEGDEGSDIALRRLRVARPPPG